MRILFVHNRADDAVGGTLTAALNLGTALAGRGDEVVLTVPTSRGRREGSMIAAAQVDVQPFEATPWAARFGFSWRQLRWLWRSVRAFESVHVHSCFYAAAFYTAWICRLRGVPYVVWPHGSLDAYDVRKHATVKQVVGPLLIRPLLARALLVACTSRREVDDLTTYGARPRVEQVPLPVPPIDPPDGADATRARWREAHALAPTTMLVAFLGRITVKKQLPLLLDAFATLGDLDAHLVIAGRPDSDELARDIDARLHRGDLRARVTSLGWIDPATRAEVLSAADVFALPSQNENFGLAVVEAMSAGVAPVISPDVYLAADFVQDGAAEVVPATLDAVAAALRRLAGEPAHRRSVGATARRVARERYAPAVVADRLHHLLMAGVG